MSDKLGTQGMPTFYCSKNFKLPLSRFQVPASKISKDNPIIVSVESEPCGIHQADLWCIINGQVCQHLVMGLKPIDSEVKEIRQAIRGNTE